MPSTARELHPDMWLAVTCLGCDRMGDADLPALIASGRGDVDVRDLPWRCSACGCWRFGFRHGLSAEGHRRSNAAHYADLERRRDQWDAERLERAKRG